MRFGTRTLSLHIPKVMGILNVTPDSFYDGGAFFSGKKIDISACLRRAEDMVSQGAHFIDVGGESTRPGAESISPQEEIDRVLPVIDAISRNLDVVISVDTSNPNLITQSAALGAGLINDVRALEFDGALTAAAHSGLPVCLMHMRGDPLTMQDSLVYSDVVADVQTYFDRRIKSCIEAGIALDNIILDPGIGFGKSDEHNVALLKSSLHFASEGCPVLIGVSRKSMVGRLLSRDVQRRLAGSLAFAYAALQHGASILRVHDVEETVDIVNVYTLMQEK